MANPGIEIMIVFVSCKYYMALVFGFMNYIGFMMKMLCNIRYSLNLMLSSMDYCRCAVFMVMIYYIQIGVFGLVISNILEVLVFRFFKKLRLLYRYRDLPPYS